MTTRTSRRTAQNLFDAGLALYRQKRYTEALAELNKTEHAFRALDARGHILTHRLENGVSGLANTLALSGRCHQMLGVTDKAAFCYETSLIHERFERKKPFQRFFTEIRDDLISCYEERTGMPGDRKEKGGSVRNLDIDIAYRFPFSLIGDAFFLARLYELAPERYPELRDFFLDAQEQDDKLRASDAGSDHHRMTETSAYLWLIIAFFGTAYIALAARVLLSR